MINKKMYKKTALSLFAALSLSQTQAFAGSFSAIDPLFAVSDNTRILASQRPDVSKRLFHSDAVEEAIDRVKKQLKNPYMAWMFENCFPNTLDTTVHYRTQDGDDDTFVYTGDIHAMWLRD